MKPHAIPKQCIKIKMLEKKDIKIIHTKIWMKMIISLSQIFIYSAKSNKQDSLADNKWGQRVKKKNDKLKIKNAIKYKGNSTQRKQQIPLIKNKPITCPINLLKDPYNI